MWTFDSTSLHPSAMWHQFSIYQKMKTSYAFTADVNDELLQKIITRTFTQGSAILRVTYYNPSGLIVHYLAVKEKVNKIEKKAMLNGFIIYTLSSVDI